MVLDKVPQKRKVKSKPKEQKLNVPEANGTPAKKSRSLRQTDNEKTTTPGMLMPIWFLLFDDVAS